MIIDKQTQLSDGQTLTATANATYDYDAGAQGDAVGSKLWIIVRAKTKLDSANHTGTLIVTVLTDSDPAFGTATTLITSPSSAAPVAAGTEIVKQVLPLGLKRYLRVTYTVGTENMNTGTVDAALVSDVDDKLTY